MEDEGHETVHKHVGIEPSGEKFNNIKLNNENKPHNPCINAGAIMVCSLIRRDLDDSNRYSYVLQKWQELSASKRIYYDNTVYLSERTTSDVNHALAYLMMSKNAFPAGTDIKRTLEFYFQCCSL